MVKINNQNNPNINVEQISTEYEIPVQITRGVGKAAVKRYSRKQDHGTRGNTQHLDKDLISFGESKEAKLVKVLDEEAELGIDEYLREREDKSPYDEASQLSMDHLNEDSLHESKEDFEQWEDEMSDETEDNDWVKTLDPSVETDLKLLGVRPDELARMTPKQLEAFRKRLRRRAK